MTARPVQICAVIKADAYGLGAKVLTPHLRAMGVDMLCVFNFDQAKSLFQGGEPTDERMGPPLRHGPVLVLQCMDQVPEDRSLIAAARNGLLHLSVDHVSQLEALGQFAKAIRQPLPIHLHLDTGMARGGLNAVQFDEALTWIQGGDHLRLQGIHSHFATARDDVGFMDRQLARFERVIEDHRPRIGDHVTMHLASTLPSRRSQKYHRSMVRIGLGLYGYGTEVADCNGLPSSAFGSSIESSPHLLDTDGLPALRPVVQWRSRVVHTQRYAKGTPIGYGCSHYLREDSLVGLIPVGYGDGYPIALSNKAIVELLDEQGKVFATSPVVGKVSMDQITVDLTAVEREFPGMVTSGLAVRLLSAEYDSPCALHRLAEQAASSSYEILCRISPRIPRVYLRDGVALGAAKPNAMPDGTVGNGDALVGEIGQSKDGTQGEFDQVERTASGVRTEI